MGGCRCAFRDCPVGTSQFPGMHFFHFPINDRVRYARWLSLANAKHFLEMPLSFQRNRVVCARHFRVECFKNYKREGIISKKAEPTLMRLNEDMALDYANEEENGGPELITVPVCTMKHLIPPPSYTFPFSLHDNLKPKEYIKKKNIILGKSRGGCIMGKPEDDRKSQSKKRNLDEALEDDNTNSVKKFKILNSEVMSTSSNSSETTSPDTIININLDDCGSMLDIALNSVENSLLEEVYESAEFDDNVIVDNIIDECTVNFANDNLLLKQQYDELTKQLQDKYADQEKEKEELSLRVQEFEGELEKSKIELNLKESILQKNQMELEKTNARLKCSLQNYQELDVNYKKLKEVNETATRENRRLAQENRQLRDKCEEYEKQRKQKCIGEVTTSQPTSSFAEETVKVSSRQPITLTNSMPNSLSKAQLFNGVKKYISSSMAAFLRMEMFGSADREWKPDERRVSMNLMQLGDEVYKYVSDEWRFRLPAIGVTRSWFADTTNSLDDDEEL